MIKNTYILLILTVAIFTVSCEKKREPIVPFDHHAQANKDNDSIVKFLKTHFFDEKSDSIKPLKKGETTLKEDKRLKSKTVKEFGIDYTYYYFVAKQGTPKIDKGFPAVTDSILSVYKLRIFSKTNKFDRTEELSNPAWFYIKNIQAKGFLHGFTHFKGGDFKKQTNGPIVYKNGGKGFFILPSGLAYRNKGANANKIFLFYVELYDFVKNTGKSN